MKKDELIAKIEELSNTEVATVIAERDQLAARVAELEAQPAGTSAEDAAELQRQVQDLSERLAANELTKGDPRPTVKVKNEMMLIIPPFVNIDGERMPAKELARRQDLLERLVKDGSAVLKSVKLIAEAARKA